MWISPHLTFFNVKNALFALFIMSFPSRINFDCVIVSGREEDRERGREQEEAGEKVDRK